MHSGLSLTCLGYNVDNFVIFTDRLDHESALNSNIIAAFKMYNHLKRPQIRFEICSEIKVEIKPKSHQFIGGYPSNFSNQGGWK